MQRFDNRYELSSFEVEVLGRATPEYRFDRKYRLSPTEERIARHLCYPLTNEGIAAIFGISFRVAKNHVSDILGKLQVKSRHDVITKAQP